MKAQQMISRFKKLFLQVDHFYYNNKEYHDQYYILLTELLNTLNLYLN